MRRLQVATGISGPLKAVGPPLGAGHNTGMGIEKTFRLMAWISADGGLRPWRTAGFEPA
jgi:hypothetical protein